MWQQTLVASYLRVLDVKKKSFVPVFWADVGAHPLLLHALRLTHDGWNEVRDGMCGMEGESLRLMWLVSATA